MYICGHAWEVCGATVGELATAAGVSENAVVRFSQELGYSGYRELSNELALALGQAAARSFSIPSEALPGADDQDLTSHGLVLRLLELEVRALSNTAQHLSGALVDQAVEALCGARRIAFAAMGSTAPIAQIATYRLLMHGVDALWSSDPYVAIANAGVLQKGDVAFGISYSGQSELTIQFLEFARDGGASTIALTAVPGSPITLVADIALSVFGPDVELSPGLQRFASRLSAMALVDALVAALAVRNFGPTPTRVEVARARMQQTLEPPISRRSRARSGPAGRGPDILPDPI
jgi:DNA-binding MurR/RpiR family transcriptional regulator